MKSIPSVLHLLALGLVGGALFSSCVSKPFAARNTVAFVNVTVVPMDRERLLERQTVLVSEGRIAAVGPADRVVVPKGATRIDGTGRYLMPGLTDMHVHLQSPHEFALYLANGVTTVFNLSGTPAHLRWREQIEAGIISGPTIYTCGPIIFHADNLEEAAQIVEAQSRAGYDSIKIYNDVSKEAYPVLVETARRKGMLVVGHIPRAVGLEGVLAARQPIAHAEEYLYTFFNGKTEDESRVAEAVSLTRKAGVPVILTLVLFDHILRQAEDLPAFLTRPEIKYLTPWSRATWGSGLNRYNPRLSSPNNLRFLRQGLVLQKTLAQGLHRAGVKIMAGTDSMVPGAVPGFSLHEELRILVEMGITPFEAFRAATRYPGEFLSPTAEFGTVAVGHRADLLLLEADPLVAITNAERRVGVMAGGRWFPKAVLEKMLEEIPQACAQEQRLMRLQLKRGSGGLSRYLQDNDPFGLLALQVSADFIAERGFARFQELIAGMRKRDPGGAMTKEEFMNELGTRLLQSNRSEDAIAVLEFNVEAHPRSAKACAQLAEARLMNGDKAAAIRWCRRALELDPTQAGSIKMLKTLTESEP